MKNNLKIICLSLLIMAFAGTALAASTSIDPMKLGVGARSLAMGRTNLVAPGDINAVFVNPANAAYIENWGLTSMYTSLLEGEMNYTLIGTGKKFDFGGMGLAFLSGGTTGIDVTTRDADGRIAATGNSFDYGNSVIALSWGRILRENLAGGALLKSFNKGFSDGYSSGSGFDLDLGLVFKQRENLTFGLAIQNLLPTGLAWGTDSNEDVPMLIRGGLSYLIRKDVLLAADLDLSPFALHTGVEWTVSPAFALRGGFDQVPTGSSTLLNLCLGLGLNFRGFKFDYAYYRDSSLDANSTHYFTLGYIAPGAKEEIKKIEPEPKPPVVEPPKPLPKPAPEPRVKSELAKRIEAYIERLETKLEDAEKAKDTARIEKLEGMIEEQKIRLQQELEK